MTKRMALVTFGCQMNVHDSQRIESLMRAEGYEVSTDALGADLIVLNTCSVREKAEQKLRSEVGRLKRHGATLVVAGCFAQQEGPALLKAVPFIDVVIGPDNLAELPELVRRAQGGARPAARTVFDLDDPRFLSAEAHPGRTGASAYVTVMKGCDERCSFCVVPYTRGPERYRPAHEVIAELRALVGSGAREVVLLGQTVNSYLDPSAPARRESDPDESQFPELLRRIALEVSGLDRLRYTSAHPRHVTPSLLRAHAELDVLASHIHMPVQSGSDRVLKRMIRRYTRAEYVSRVGALKRAREGTSLTTDIIVGFPGETRDDFEATLSLVREMGFAALYGFKYSPRPQTPALRLDDDVPEEEKQSRLAELFEVSDALTLQSLEALVGTRQQVLLEGPSRPGASTLMGRTRRNEICHMHVVEGASVGAVVWVEVVRANRHSLEVRVESIAAAAPESLAPTFKRRSLPVVSA